ncbi:MAG: hypothetical protein OXC28_15615 [Defluviicoccus sp.]|nr:hypothetical protein [Defluviicoccus sp.]
MMDGESIGETILSGIQSANHDYETCSNGWWLTDSGAKGPIVLSIAERLCAMRGAGESVVLELPYRYILEWSGAGPARGRPPQPLSGRGRADIVLLDNDGRPACVIDVERVWDRVRCFSSLTRLRDLVIQSHDRENGSLRQGFLTLMLAASATAERSAQQAIEREAARIGRLVRSEFDGRGLQVRCRSGRVRHASRGSPDASRAGDWAHAGFCVALSTENLGSP